MNGKKAKQLRKKSKELVIEWLKTMLIDEEKKNNVVMIDGFIPNVVLRIRPCNKPKSLI